MKITFLLVALALEILLANGYAADTHLAPRPTFQPGATNGEFMFDTGALKGKLRAGGQTRGISSVSHTPTGVVLDRSMGLFSHYRVFATGKRYGAGVWDLPSRARLRGDGAVEIEVSDAPGRPFQFRAIYSWHDEVTLDLETIVTARADLPGFEVFLASYFQPRFTNALVLASEQGRSQFARAGRAAGEWQIFPRDDRSLALIKDGRWTLPPNPVDWTARGTLTAPLAVRRAPDLNLTAILMAPKGECFAVSMPYETEPHYSTYLSLFGRDIKSGETARARSRLTISGPLTDREIEALYGRYAAEISASR